MKNREKLREDFESQKRKGVERMDRDDILVMFFSSLIVITILLLSLIGVLAEIESDMKIIVEQQGEIEEC